MKKSFLILGAVAVGAFLWMRRGSGGGATGKFMPAAIKSGEKVTAATYRVISARRPALAYVAVEEGQRGGPITFAAPQGGRFTRNVIDEGGRLYAEVAA